MHKQTKLFIFITGLLLLSIGLTQHVGANHEPDATTFLTPQPATISTDTTWKDVNFNLDETTVVSDANLTIIDSVITISNTGLTHGITVDNGTLKIVNSEITFDGIDHAVFGISYGTINYEGATISSDNGDATHLEGDYEISINNSVFKDTGDDGLHVADNSIPFTVENSLFYNIGDDAFDLLEVDTAELINSRIELVKGHAIKIISSGNITLRDIFADGEGATVEDDNRGMDIENSQKVVVDNATITNFPSDGIKVQRTPFVGNAISITNTNDEGIEFENTVSEYPISLNDISIVNANGGDSIKIEFVEGHISINNTFVSNGGDDGIQITQGNTTAEISNTYVTGSAEDGFELDSSTWLVMNNVTSSGNEENGIKFKTIGDVTISNSEFSNNKFIGISSSNATLLEMKDTRVESNLEGGLFIQNSNTFSLTDSVVRDNKQTNVRATGVNIGGISNYTLSTNEISANSGSGVLIDNSNGTIVSNVVSGNLIDGIGISGRANFDIKDNTITGNGQNGLSIINGSRGLVTNNTFSANVNYGVYVELEGAPLDLSGNYWGSDDGPIWQDVGSDERDGVFGNVLVSNYLTSEGVIRSYEPPTEFDYQLLSYIIIASLIVITIAGLIFYQMQVKRWKRETEPLALIYINRIGLPVMEYHFTDGRTDPALISGFLSAVSSFGSEIYAREGSNAQEAKKIREIQSKENVIVLYLVERSMIALIVRNSNPTIRGTLDNFGDDFINLAQYEKGEDIDEKVENMDVDKFDKLVKNKFKDFEIYTSPS